MRILPIEAEDTWPLRHQIMWPDHPLEFVKIPEDQEGLHYGLFVDDVLTSIISLFYIEGQVQFRKFATITNQQGKGYGTTLLKFIMEKVSKESVEAIWCNARKEKYDYYAKFGLLKTEKEYTKGGIEFVVIKKQF